MEAHVPVRTRIAAELRTMTADGSRRRSPRAAVAIEGALAGTGEHGSLCRVTDLSLHGARIQTFGEFRADMLVFLTLPGNVNRTARVVWFRDFEVGCHFEHPLSDDEFTALTAS